MGRVGVSHTVSSSALMKGRMLVRQLGRRGSQMYDESLWMDHVYTQRLFLNQWLTASPGLANASRHRPRGRGRGFGVIGTAQRSRAM